MLITNLGKARQALMASFNTLTDEQLNRPSGAHACSIAQIIFHLYTSEIETAKGVLEALPRSRATVAEQEPASLADRLQQNDTAIAPLTQALSKAELIRLLEESRFRYLQDVFNETHAQTLAEKSVHHPIFGEISLKNLVDTVWLREQQHTRQILKIKETL